MKKAVWGSLAALGILLIGGYALWSWHHFQTLYSDPSGEYMDGVYIGDARTVPYGNVQTRVTVSGGKVTAVEMLQVPQGPGYTNELTARTFPILIQEVIEAQSPIVNVVSGATVDSNAFQLSFWSALSQARR